jgi:hypothetical protein
VSSSYDSLDEYPFRPIREAWSSIDRSSAERVQEDAQTLETGELLIPKQEVYMNWPRRATVVGPDGSTVYSGRLDTNARCKVEKAGRYRVVRSGETVGTFEVVSGTGNSGEETTGDPDDWTNVDNSNEIDPSNYAGIVNADNEQGIALAPSLRREGAELGPEGATVTLPDGETVDVGAISDADEVARYTSGSNAGDVIDADQDAVNSGSSANSDAIGASGAVLGALALAYLIYRRQ